MHFTPEMEAAHKALHAEGEAILNVAAHLLEDDQFPQVVKAIQGLKGRVIVTGVGKSGHIAGKIAATLASTGTPAFFVHPTEALHGDLGMVTKDDLVLALSHSGESKELAAVIQYCSRFSIALVALTGKADSTLGRAATYVLNTHVTAEACPLNLAPTTSTTVALAMADALAIALMTARGFSHADFAVFHPGGKLGAQLLRVSEVMVYEHLPLLPATAGMEETIVTLTRGNLGCVGFTDAEGKLVGIFTDGDLKRHISAVLLSKKAADVFTPNPKVIGPKLLATTGVQQMQAQKVKALWVVDDSHRPLGLFRLDECLARGVI